MASSNQSTDKNSPAGKQPGKPDELIKGDKSKTELNEDDLKKVSGGLKIDVEMDHKH